MYAQLDRTGRTPTEAPRARGAPKSLQNCAPTPSALLCLCPRVRGVTERIRSRFYMLYQPEANGRAGTKTENRATSDKEAQKIPANTQHTRLPRQHASMDAQNKTTPCKSTNNTGTTPAKRVQPQQQTTAALARVCAPPSQHTHPTAFQRTVTHSSHAAFVWMADDNVVSSSWSRSRSASIFRSCAAGSAMPAVNCWEARIGRSVRCLEGLTLDLYNLTQQPTQTSTRTVWKLSGG